MTLRQFGPVTRYIARPEIVSWSFFCATANPSVPGAAWVKEA